MTLKQEFPLRSCRMTGVAHYAEKAMKCLILKNLIDKYLKKRLICLRGGMICLWI